MSDAVEATATAAPAEQAQAAEAPKSRAEAISELATKHNLEQQMAKVEGATKPEPAKPAAKGEAERGPDGKFLPKDKAAPKPAKTTDAKTTAGVADDKSAPAPSDDGAGRSDRDSIARVRRLLSEGKATDATEALERLVGGPVDSLVNSKAFSALKREAAKAHQAVEAERGKVEQMRAQLNGEIAQVQSQYRPLVEAARARDAGDWEKAAELFFGVPAHQATKGMLEGKLKRPAADPKVSELEQRLAAYERREAEQRAAAEKAAQDKAAEEKAAADRAQAEQWLADQYAEIEAVQDARIQKVAKRQAFRDAVLEQFRKHWNPRLGITTVSATEAAELAFEELYGDLLGDPGAPAAHATTSAQSGGSRDHGAKTGGGRPARVTTLVSKEAAEAAPEVPLEGDALKAYYVKKAIAAQMREKGLAVNE